MSMKKKNTMPVLQLSFCHYCLCVSDFIHVKFVSFKFPTDVIIDCVPVQRFLLKYLLQRL